MMEKAGNQNPFRCRGYCWDEETGLYYVGSRYYDPETCRFISPDTVEVLTVEQGNLNQHNLYAYCLNNPVNLLDEDGHLSIPNWAKVAIGAVTTVAAVGIAFVTGCAISPILIGVAASIVLDATVSAVNYRVTAGSWKGAGKAVADGAANGFMWGGLCALGGSIIRGAVKTIKNAKYGITIGKQGTYEEVAKLAEIQHYSGLKEFKLIEKWFGKKAAETVGWWQNKYVVKSVMALNGAIYDCGGALTGAYAKEVALTRGYKYLYTAWLM